MSGMAFMRGSIVLAVSVIVWMSAIIWIVLQESFEYFVLPLPPGKDSASPGSTQLWLGPSFPAGGFRRDVCRDELRRQEHHLPSL